MNIKDILELAIKAGASDLHLRVATPPVIRINGGLAVLNQLPPMSIESLEKVFQEITNAEQREQFKNELDLDFSYDLPEAGRFRVSLIRQRGTMSFAIRIIPTKAPKIDEIGLPKICKELALKPRGLIIIAGQTGSGKSTTLTAMVNYLNENLERNIITIEDPIEYIYRNKKSIILQQELGEDTRSFATALKHALRHDPDVIVVGEMRDLDTMSIAVRAAETGHLVMSTMHTNDAPQTVDTIIHLFPPSQHEQVRMQLSRVLEAVICQTLVHRADKKGRIPVCEIMVGNNAVRNLIREGRSHELSGVMQYSSKDGMQTRNQVLVSMVKRGIIEKREALAVCSNPEQLINLLNDTTNINGDLISAYEPSNGKSAILSS